jgi:hypothetical protein
MRRMGKKCVRKKGKGLKYERDKGMEERGRRMMPAQTNERNGE